MNNYALVITSINSAENKILQEYAKKAPKHGFRFIVVGDEKSPDNFELSGCEFLSLKDQLNSGFELAKILPARHYARKNIGYLTAMKHGANVIIETDDDNYAKNNFWDTRESYVNADLYENAGWFNVYNLFSGENIWPRGFSLEHIKNVPDKSKAVSKKCYCPVQQGLADENPDVDAIYRMAFSLPFNFKKTNSAALGNNTWCPFNSQNTTWFKEVFMLMYLPSYCSFRMTDIWRSFVVQRICWENDMDILFHNATVWQERNEHNLLSDFKDELSGYNNNDEIIKRLTGLKLKRGTEFIPDNLRACYKVFIDMNLMDKRELDLINAWIKDVSMY